MKSLWVKKYMGEKYVQEGFLGEESLNVCARRVSG